MNDIALSDTAVNDTAVSDASSRPIAIASSRATPREPFS